MPEDTGLVMATFTPRSEWYKLESVPGGQVQIQRLSYGARLEKLQLSSTLRTSFKTQQQGSHGRPAAQQEEMPAEIRSAVRDTTYLDFKYCILDHNLSNQVGRKLNFANPADIDALEGAVGAEIAELINTHNSVLKDENADAAHPEGKDSQSSE